MLAKNKIKQSFAAAASAYDSVALLQRKVGESLLQQLEINDQVHTIIDLGCGTGFLTHALVQGTTHQSAQVIALDIAFPMLQTALSKEPHHHYIDYLCADAESLPIQSKSVELIISNLSFQWCNLEKVLSEAKRILKPGGQFLFSTFGSNTLHELKNAWSQVDYYQHVNTFCNINQLANCLQDEGFQDIKLDTKLYRSIYESVWDLMFELKHLGAHVVLEGANKQLTTKGKMRQMISAYQKQAEDGLVPATFEVITAKAKA